MVYVIKVKYGDSLRRLTFDKVPGAQGLSFADLEVKIREIFQIPDSAKLIVTYVDKEGDVVTMQSDHDLKDACFYQSLNPVRMEVVIASPAANFAGGPSRTSSFRSTFEGLEEPFKDLFKNLRPENVKKILQAYEPIFKDVKHPSQLPDLVENIVKTVASQFASLSKNGDGSPAIPATNQNESASQDGAAQAQNEAKDFSGHIHYGVVCDECGTTPILGVRYKSITKADYDLCSSCYAKVGASSTEHARANEYVTVDIAPFRPRHWRHPRGRMMCPAMGPVGHMPRFSHYGMRATQDGQGGRLDARFVRDVSIFDGTELLPGTRFTKIWRLRNSGTLTWPASTSLVNIDGDDLGSVMVTPLEIREQGVAPDEEIEVSVDCVAPQKTGRYQSIWRLATPWGPKFGHKIWVQINVVPSEMSDEPAQVDTDGGNVGGAHAVETSTAVQEVVMAEYAPEDVAVADAATVSEMMNIEDSFVKVDNEGEEAPLMEEVNVPSGTSEDQNMESVTVPTVAAEEIVHTEVLSSPVEPITTEVPVVEAVETKDPVDTYEEEESTFNPLLEKLKTMGFNDRTLNIELLKANSLDLRKTVDALCDVEDWAPAMAELAEMGFNDISTNRRLMLKNRGNLKRVVKELVQLAKQASGRI